MTRMGSLASGLMKGWTAGAAEYGGGGGGELGDGGEVDPLRRTDGRFGVDVCLDVCLDACVGSFDDLEDLLLPRDPPLDVGGDTTRTGGVKRKAPWLRGALCSWPELIAANWPKIE
jgi:hypothetical protein